MKAKELRIGSLLNYQTAEGEILTTIIDWQYLKWLSEDYGGFNLVHSPIPLTEDWLLKLGFTEYHYSDDIWGWVFNYFGYINEYQIRIHNSFIEYQENPILLNKSIEYVHQLQNLYFALTGEELTIKS